MRAEAQHLKEMSKSTAELAAAKADAVRAEAQHTEMEAAAKKVANKLNAELAVGQGRGAGCGSEL